MSQIIFLKWCPSIKDQFYEKSRLEDKHKSIGNNVMETILQEGQTFIDSSAPRDNMPSNEHSFSTIENGCNNGTKRESNFERMNEREMVAQTNLNPFLSSNYLEDLQVQENFLTPQNSNTSDYKYNSNE
jgi:hypothetical protein